MVALTGKKGARATPETIQLWGGCLALDFVNTVDRDEDGGHVAPELTDVLAEPGMLVRWGERVGLLTSADASAAELAAARSLRESLFSVFAAAAAGVELPKQDLDALRLVFAAATAAGTLTQVDGACRLAWPTDELRAVRFAVAADAVRLLDDPDRLARVASCPGRLCGWLFINASGRRRWCSMSACGSREKMRRMYARRSG